MISGGLRAYSFFSFDAPSYVGRRLPDNGRPYGDRDPAGSEFPGGIRLYGPTFCCDGVWRGGVGRGLREPNILNFMRDDSLVGASSGYNSSQDRISVVIRMDI